MSHDFSQHLDALSQALQQAHDESALHRVEIDFLGKSGSISTLRGAVASLPPDQRKSYGQAFNALKTQAEQRVADQRGRIEQQARARELARVVDLSAPAPAQTGALHIVTQTERALIDVFRGLGFDVAEGPHVEVEKYNFDDLNIVSWHPARDMQDTFFVRPGPHQGVTTRDLVLRTHTSPVQIRTMLTQPPPIRIIAPGRVFRRDDDATHTPMFHQIEGLYVDRNVTMADLKATLLGFVRAFFGPGLNVRLRPSYFPFVEPGAEFDMQCPFHRDAAPLEGCAVCRGSGWLELGGAGMVHPAVFEAVGLDPEQWSGWAFGFGIDRMAMLMHGVRDLRLLFEGDQRFLEQFPC